MRYRFIALALCLLSGCKIAVSAGFDCSLANLSPTEKTICSNEYLSGLDSALNNFLKKPMTVLLAVDVCWNVKKNG
ncbi:hypothetical protein [Escherichia coli]|uniref:hypothetical protein n=1 Tax=Escherichia coli TaxID=562 RepID=UPI00102DA89D|nr:hypothetical protein [Escherichia coli]RZY59762.1 hypothetical protein EXX39_24865 [Escherichia coli]